MSGRALLMGVSEYDSDAIQDLEFVANDLTSLGDALTNIGYETTLLGASGKRSPTHNSIIHSVNDFCRNDVQDDEIAILYFSGHGLHYHGKDYLVPSDATLGDEIIEQVMVPLDFAAAYEQSRASTILFFVDACREGVDLGEKGGLGYQQWTQGKRETVRDQQSAYVYACGPGEVCRYVGGPEGFSLFSRALAEILQEPRSALPMTFGRVRNEVQKRLDELADQHRKERQNVRIVSESGTSEGNLLAIQLSTGGLRAGAIESNQPSVDVEAIGDLTITEEDVRLMSYDQSGSAPWIEGTVPIVHILRSAAALERPVDSVIARLQDFEPVGIKVPDVNLEIAAQIELDRDDLVLLPSGEDFAAYQAEISAIQVLYAANRLGRPVDEILGRLRRFEAVGIKLPEIDPGTVRGLMVNERDLTMLSTDLDRQYPWLQGEVPVVHILKVAKYLEEPVGAVVARLRNFEPCGISISLEVDDYIDRFMVSEDDLRILSENLEVGGPWLESPVPIGHVMYVANKDDQTIGEALGRLSRFEPFGFEMPRVDGNAAALTVPKEDLVLISRDLDGIAPWVGGEIPAARLLAAANKFDESVGSVCERIGRYQGAGLSHSPMGEGTAAADLVITDEDMLLLSGSDAADPSLLMYDVLPVAHVLYVAHELDESVDEAAGRATRLESVGVAAPAINWEGAQGLRVSDEDIRLLSADLDGERPWIEQEVDWFHLLRAAHALDETLDRVVARIAKFEAIGYSVPDVDGEIAGLTISDEDLTALSRDLDSYEPWIGDGPVEALHLMEASSTLDEPIGDVIDRIRRFEPLGIALPDITNDALSLQVKNEDLIVLSQDLDAAAPWVGREIPMGHILAAASKRGEEVGKIVDQLRRFEGLGFVVPPVDERGAKLRFGGEDLVLLSRNLDARPPWAEHEIPVIHLLRAASHLGEPVKQTFERLRRLETVDAVTLMPFFAEPSRSWRRRAHRPF